MRPFTIYGRLQQQFPDQQQKLISLILELIQPDKIYLLGATLKRRRTESIFQPDAPAAHETSEYFLLVLMDKLDDKPLYEWQDRLEQKCQQLNFVTVIVLETAKFSEGLLRGDIFSRKILQNSPLIYNSSNILFDLPTEFDQEETNKAIENNYQHGLKSAQEFIVGADLFRIRNQNKLAAFLLHQAAEQCLRALLKVGIGINQTTHNLDRLIRCASMISYRIPDIFPRNSDKEKKLFTILNKAYSDARYDKNYSVQAADLALIFERVCRMVEILIEFRRKAQSANAIN